MLIAMMLDFLFKTFAYYSAVDRQQTFNQNIIRLIFYLSGIMIYFSFLEDCSLEYEIINKTKIVSLGGFLFSFIIILIDQISKAFTIVSRLEENSELIPLGQKVYMFLKTIKEAN
jgi:hypothetical protein